jgi:hypothetical protein
MRLITPLLPLTSGHFVVANLEAALDGNLDLHHFDDARSEFVALSSFRQSFP